MTPILQIQISAYGREGLDSFAAHRHPRVQGVCWLVCVQVPEGETVVPKALAEREDIEVVMYRDKGLSRNRNHGLEHPGESEWILIGDDDVDYTAEGLQALLEALQSHPEAGVVCGRYKCRGEYVKAYGEGEFNLRKPPYGWYVTSFEMAVRRSSIGKLRFDERFGIGSGHFVAGEESLFLHDLLRSGAVGVGVPVDICSHEEATTGERLRTDPDFLKTYGAVLVRLKPVTWPLRLVLHAWRTPLPFFRCLSHTLRGALTHLPRAKGVEGNG